MALPSLAPGYLAGRGPTYYGAWLFDFLSVAVFEVVYGRN